MSDPTVSVVINTYNRAHHLKRLLDCLARQTYKNFEVIVVNGPSTDGTEHVLEEYRSAIRIESCSEVNLCRSRNIGVKAAAGEILAFIDDDAVPQNNHWIENAVRYFVDETVGIVSGAVLRINGNVEFEYGYFSIWGDNIGVSPYPKQETELKDGWFRGSAGGNTFLRRSAVSQVNGFDEYYRYYMDETDLCLRIEQAGYHVEYGTNMAIIHEAAKSVNRKSPYHLNWDVIARSRCYFTIKASEITSFSREEREKKAQKACNEWRDSFKSLLSEKKISKEDYKTFCKMLQDGQETGIRDGFSKERRLQSAIPLDTEKFLPYDKKAGKSHMNLCLFCDDDILNPCGGVPVYTKALAYGLSRLGHNVYVITRGSEELLSNIDGVNLCYVMPENVPVPELEGLPISRNRLNFSYACFTKLQQLKKSFFIDLAESPIWDSYGVVTAYLEHEIPLATRLQTPLKMVMDTFQKEDSADLDVLMEFETALLTKSQRIITISDCVKDTIEKLYNIKFTQPISKNYLGINPEQKASSSRTGDGKLIVFFIGRLERRKGIDSIIASIPTLMEKYSNLEFHLAGDCDIFDEVIGDTYKNKLLRDNRGAKWLKRVHFMGKVSDEVKEQEYAECDVFVSPSLYESFGIIFIEAMRYAKPVIGCKAGGMQEVIADGETGLLCKPGDAADFERCLDRLLSDATLREKMGKAGLERLSQKFTETAMCKRCEEIYRDMLQNRRI